MTAWCMQHHEVQGEPDDPCPVPTCDEILEPIDDGEGAGYGLDPRYFRPCPYHGTTSLSMSGECMDCKENDPVTSHAEELGMHQSSQSAAEILRTAADTIEQRGTERDQDGERSMARAVAAFNALFSHELTETEGWQFMVILKMARSAQGAYQPDDYTDQTAYSALAAEAASKGD